MRVLDEQVVDVDALELVAHLQLVAVHEPVVGGEGAGQIGRLQDVGLAELVRAEVDRGCAAGARGGAACAERIRADREVGEALAFRRQLAPLITAIGHAGFGGQFRRPLRVQLDRVVVLVFRLRIPVGVEAERGGRGRALGDRREGVTIAGADALVVGEVVVQLDRRLLVVHGLHLIHLTRLQRRRGGIVVPACQGRIDVGSRGIGTRGDTGDLVEEGPEAEARGSRRRHVEAGIFFIGHGEEQPVPDDRAGQEGTVVRVVDVVLDLGGRLQKPDRAVCVRGGRELLKPVPEQAGGPVQVEEGAVEVVAPRLQDHVQGTAGEVAVFHVERGRLDGDLLDGFQGDRAAVGGQAAGVQAVVILRAHAVDGDPVAAGRGAGDVQAARRARAPGHEVKLGQRVAAGNVADVALHRHDLFDVGGLQRGAGAHIGEVRIRLLLAADGHRRDFRGGGEIQGHPTRVAHGQVDVVQGLILQLRSLAEHRVGTADPQAAGVEHAGRVGHQGRLGTGRLVNDRDRHTGDRRTRVVHGDAAQGRGGLLGIGCRRKERGRKSARSHRGCEMTRQHRITPETLRDLPHPERHLEFHCGNIHGICAKF